MRSTVCAGFVQQQTGACQILHISVRRQRTQMDHSGKTCTHPEQNRKVQLFREFKGRGGGRSNQASVAVGSVVGARGSSRERVVADPQQGGGQINEPDANAFRNPYSGRRTPGCRRLPRRPSDGERLKWPSERNPTTMSRIRAGRRSARCSELCRFTLPLGRRDCSEDTQTVVSAAA
jgi:hypothetical protein